MKVTVGKKFITITPKPDRNIPNGLTAKFNRDGEFVTAYATCNIVKGKSRYKKPDYPSYDGRHVIEAYLS